MEAIIQLMCMEWYVVIEWVCSGIIPISCLLYSFLRPFMDERTSKRAYVYPPDCCPGILNWYATEYVLNWWLYYSDCIQ